MALDLGTFQVSVQLVESKLDLQCLTFLVKEQLKTAAYTFTAISQKYKTQTFVRGLGLGFVRIFKLNWMSLN